MNNQLSAQGLQIQAGAVNIVDATVIEAHQSRPRKNAQGQSTQDPDAGYNVKTNSQGHRAQPMDTRGILILMKTGLSKR